MFLAPHESGSYRCTIVLRPAVSAIEGVSDTLREFEKLLELPPAHEPDINDAKWPIEVEDIDNENYEQEREERAQELRDQLNSNNPSS